MGTGRAAAGGQPHPRAASVPGTDPATESGKSVAATDARPPPLAQPGRSGNVRELTSFEGATDMFIHPHTLAALGAERHKSMLAQADAARLARQARAGRPRAGAPVARRSPRHWLPGRLRPGWSRPFGHRPESAVNGGQVVLRDGSTVLIRQVQGTDAPLLADGFARLSARSRRMRFLAAKPELSPAELGYLTDVDHRDHEALGALNQADGRGLGIARYVRDAEDPQAAE